VKPAFSATAATNSALFIKISSLKLVTK